MLLDRNVLQQSCGGDEEFARELFGEYHQRVLELLIVMRDALGGGRVDDLRKAAHELKGSSLTLGADNMAQLSRELEEACKAGNIAPAPETIRQMDDQSQQLFVHLKELGYL